LAAKLLGLIAATFSVIFGFNQVTSLVSAERERTRHVAELVSVASSEQRAGEYAAAWSHLEEAAKLGDATGIIAEFVGNAAKNSAMVRSRQEDLAMAWLENVSLAENQKFTDIVNQVGPLLELGASRAVGARKADMLAHLGWGEFLARRDGVSTADPTARYREALAADANNPFALAYLGHWEMWRRGSLTTAKNYFAAALATGREHAWVRRMQLSALRNAFPDADAGAEYLRVVNEMRTNGEPIDERTRSEAFQVYYFAFGGDAVDAPWVLDASAPAEQLVTFKQLFDTPEFAQAHPDRDLYLAALQEAAGQKPEALQTLAKLKHSVPPGSPLAEKANRATRRILAQ
jgi:tetratricopeptide (TPR) repeat protein